MRSRLNGLDMWKERKGNSRRRERMHLEWRVEGGEKDRDCDGRIA